MYVLNLSELHHGYGWCLFSLLEGNDFFPPTSHLVCLFRPNKRETERHRSSADDRDGSGVGQCACTHTHTHTHTHKHTGQGQQMEGAPICCRCWSQARWAGPPLGLIGGPLIPGVQTDFEEESWVQKMWFYFAWQTCLMLGIVTWLHFFGGW